VVSPCFVIILQKNTTFALEFLIASGTHFTSKFGIIEVYKSHGPIIIISEFSKAFTHLWLAETSGVKKASLIPILGSCFGTSIFVSPITFSQLLRITQRFEISFVTGITFHCTRNILQTCFNPSSKSQVISVIAVNNKLPTVCPDTEESFWNLYSKSFLKTKLSLLKAKTALLISQGGSIQNSSLSTQVDHQLSLIATSAAKFTLSSVLSPDNTLYVPVQPQIVVIFILSNTIIILFF
jgi:hypothetical protein